MIKIKSLFLCCVLLTGPYGVSASVLKDSGASPQEKYGYLQSLANGPTSVDESPFQSLVIQALKDQSAEALYELAYAANGFSGQLKRDKELSQLLLSPYVERGDSFAKVLNDFIQKRSIIKAEALLDLAGSPRQRALAFMGLAEAHFARKSWPKAMLYSVLSLATYPSEVHDKQVQFYLSETVGKSFSLLQPREELLDQLNRLMEAESSPEKFRLLFDIATVVGLLHTYPLEFGKGDSIPPKPICFAFDENYAKHAGVAMLSAVLSAAPETRYAFNVMEDVRSPISDSSKESLQQILSLLGDDRFQINYTTVEDDMLPDVLHVDHIQGWPRILYFTLLVPKLFQKFDKVLYLDSDLIVRTDLGPLFDEIKGSLLSGTRDVRAAEWLSHLSLPYNSSYINGGVLLFNVKKFKQKGLCNALGDSFSKYPDLSFACKFVDQDLIAALFQGEINEIGAQRNLPAHKTECTSVWNWFAQEHPSAHWRNIHHHFANIIHMEGNEIKPWKKSIRRRRWKNNPKKNNGIQDLYWALRDMGPWPT